MGTLRLCIPIHKISQACMHVYACLIVCTHMCMHVCILPHLHTVAYLGVGLGRPVPYQRGLVPHQSPRLRYSYTVVSNSNRAVTVITVVQQMQTMKVTNKDLGFIPSGGLSSHYQIVSAFFFWSSAFSAVCPTKPDSLDQIRHCLHNLCILFVLCCLSYFQARE